MTCEEDEGFLHFLASEIPKLAACSRHFKKPSRWYTLTQAMDSVKPESTSTCAHGDLWLEFGVFEGESITLMAQHPSSPNKVYGFDSFTGLPDASTDGRSDWLTKRFDRGGMLPSVPDKCELIQGWFAETLPAFVQRSEVQGRAASLVHIDSDLGSSATTVLDTLTDAGSIVEGTVIVFDELLHYPGWQNNEIFALYKWALSCSVEFEWICVKDRVMECSEALRISSTMPSYKAMMSQGYDQSAAMRVTSLK